MSQSARCGAISHYCSVLVALFCPGLGETDK